MREVNTEIEWLNEYVKDVPNRKKMYKFLKIILFRKNGLTYKELYMILCNLNERVVGIEKSRQHAMIEILSVYKYNNNKLPEGINLENDGV